MKRKVIYLSVAIFAVLIAFFGWQLYRQKFNSSAPKAVITKSSQDSQNSTSNSLVIKEWGVKLTLPENAKDTYYKYDSNLAVYLTTPEIENISGCRNQKTIVLERGKGDDPIGPSTVNELLRENPSALKNVGDYYYSLIVGSLGCTNNASSEQQTYFRDVVNSLQNAKNSLEPTGDNK